MLLTSPLLSRLPHLRHGFSTRLGGVSSGPYATWNLSGTDDAPESIRENRRRFARALGASGPEELVQVDQVHGTRVVADDEAAGAEADGIVTGAPGRLVGVRTADCAPILLAAVSEGGRPEAVAAVHAGWRGATAGVVAAGVKALVARGADQRRIFAAVGPCIGVEHFEVGDEVVAAAQAALVSGAPRTKLGARGRWHLDLADLCRRLLVQAGLPEKQVDVLGDCTFENAAMFYSYRRDRGVTGRHLSAIAFGALA